MLMMVDYVHSRLSTYDDLKIGVDFTMGNGHDTLYLSHICDVVYSFDIQQEAIDRTRKLMDQENVTLILDGHENFDHYLSSFDVGIFNLGYLPNMNHDLTTKLETTKIALKKAINCMQKVIFIVVYPGHDEGYKESQWIESYVTKLDPHQYHVSKYMMLNKHLSPYVVEIEKKQI